MNPTANALESLCRQYPKFLKKGGLCVALIVTETAKSREMPLTPEALRTGQRGQVAGLGKAAVQRILEAHGIAKVLAEEGGRTSRGSLGLMEAYVASLNRLHALGLLDLEEALAWWIEKVRLHFAAEGPNFHFDPGKSLRANIDDLLLQAKAMQANAGGANYLGAMLQHLVGAKLDVVLGVGKIQHYGSSVADHSTDRPGDFQFETVAIHVTTHPTEALIRKCASNLQRGLKPLIVTHGDGVNGADFLLKNSAFEDRVDVLDVSQFLTANVYERSLFKADVCRVTLFKLLERYNEIVTSCETDPSLRIKLGERPSAA